MQSNHNSIGYSSGFSSLGDKSTEHEYKLNAVRVNDTLKYQEENTRLKSELEEEKRSNVSLKKMITELTKNYEEKLENKECENLELLAEVGRLEFEQDMRINEKRKLTLLSKRENDEGRVIDPTNKECDASQNVCSAPTERQMDTIEAVTSDEENVDNVDDENFGSPQNETHSDHLQNENISPQQGDDSCNKASRTPSSVPESEIVDEEIHRPESPGTPQNNSSQEINTNNNEPNLNYHALLGIIASKLLRENVSELKDWAGGKHSNASFGNISAADILTRLDEEGVINASNLSELQSFLESIGRFDLSHTIDLFLEGDYQSI